MLSKLRLILMRRQNRLPIWAWILIGTASCAAIFLAFNGNGSQSASDIPGSNTLDSVGFAVDVFIKLCLVIGLIYVCLFFLRRWQNGLIKNPTRKISVLETVRLSPRQSIHLVKVGEQVFLVGGTDQNVAILSEIDNEFLTGGQDASQEMNVRPAKLAPASFSSLFDRSINQ